MAKEVSTEFKTAFGRMLVGLNMNYTSGNALNFSSTLLLYTRTGLYTMGVMEKYELEFRKAETIYKNAVNHLKLKGRNSYAESQIFQMCFEINKAILPIALAEGILVINETMFSVMDMFQVDPNQKGARK